MKLTLLDAEQRKGPTSFENMTLFSFVGTDGRAYTARVTSDHYNSKRWYELVCAWVSANKSNMDIFIETDHSELLGEIDPNMDFNIGIENKGRRPFTPPPADGKERERRDIDG